MNLVATLILIAGVLICLVSLPLILRRIPPNAFYGIRIKAAFASHAEWYRLNAIGGRYFVVSGTLISLVGITGFFVPASALHQFGITAAILLVAAVLIPACCLCFHKPAASGHSA